MYMCMYIKLSPVFLNTRNPHMYIKSSSEYDALSFFLIFWLNTESC